MRRFALKPSSLASVLLAACLLLAGGWSDLARAQQHQSLIRIGDPGGAPVTRRIKVGLNKSVIVELPRDVSEVMVSNPKQIDAVLQTSRRAFLIGVAPGEANIFFIDTNGQQMVTLEVTVERDLAGLRDLLNRVIPGARINVETVSGSVLLTGTVPSAIDATRAGEIASQIIGFDPTAAPTTSNSTSTTAGVYSASTSNQTSSTPTKAGQLINMIAVEDKEQVLLKVSVVEMERNIVKQFGIDLGTLINSGNFAFAALSNLPFPINTAGKGLISPFIPSDVAAAGDIAQGTPSFVSQGVAGGGVQWQTENGSRVQTVLRALEQDGLLHTLAEPNLTAISGETANFLAGGEFPIPVAQQLGTISVEFKKFGIGLAFTPVVMSDGRISLKVSTEVSELSNQGAVILSNLTIPALKVRRAETTVELPSGGSIAMAGLLSDQSKQALSGYPGLKNLPVLGTLFRSRDFLKNETELVVIVTPYIAKAVNRQRLAQPDQGFGWANDLNSDLLGQMNRIYGRNPDRAPVGRFEGDVGFVVE